MSLLSTQPETFSRRPASPKPLSSLRVWHVGGADMQLRIPLLLRLRARGAEVAAVGTTREPAFAEHEIPYWYYSMKRGVDPRGDWSAAADLYRMFVQCKPDVVHAFSTKPAILAMLAARKAGVPARIRTINGMGYVFSSASPLAMALRPIYRFLQRKASSAAAITTFQNPDDRDYFRRCHMVPDGGDALVPGSGMDVDAWLDRQPSSQALSRVRKELQLNAAPVVTMVSRLLRQKGVMEFLEAARRVHQRGVEAQFLLVGPIPAEVRRGITRREIGRFSDHVQYLGPRDDVAALLGISDLFVLPTYYREGIPRVLLEAAALGLPLIATDTPGCREVVRHGTNGLLIPPRDAEMLAGALVQLLSARRLMVQMGAASRQCIRGRFDLDTVADAYAKLYERAFKK